MTTIDLFDDIVARAPATEGIKYAGSKFKLLPQVLSIIRKVKPQIVFDGFSGTTRVAQALAKSGYSVITNDIAHWSEVFGTCYLLNSYPRQHYQSLIEHLNNLPPEDGWFTEHYGGDALSASAVGPDGLKKPWQRHNTRRLDAIRLEIDRLQLSNVERSVALTSLVLALDCVDSTMGHFSSYLNEWSPRSYKDMFLEVPALIPDSGFHDVRRGDVLDVLPNITCDLAYFDPPYGSNNEKMPPSRVRYSAYYHVWTTICLNDRPELFGKVKRRTDTSDTVGSSIFEEYRRDDDGHFIAVKAIERLIKSANAKFILLSYSTGGRATAAELGEVIARNGRLMEVVEIDYRRNVMANMRWTNDWIREAESPNKEMLFLIEKA